MKKAFKNIHLFLSIPAGIIITILCLTGFIMVFDEYLRPRWDAWGDIFRWVMRLHRWLLFEDVPTGRMIVGISTIFFVIILISGIQIWFPRKRYRLKSFFTIKWKSRFFHRLFDLHRILGVYAALMLILLCLTGLMWSFPSYRKAVSSIIQVDTVPERVAVVSRKDKQTGEIIQIDFNEASPERKLMRWVYMLHTGKWGGHFGPFLTAMASLIGASLPITGYWLFFRRMKNKSARRRKIPPSTESSS